MGKENYLYIVMNVFSFINQDRCYYRGLRRMVYNNKTQDLRCRDVFKREGRFIKILRPFRNLQK